MRVTLLVALLLSSALAQAANWYCRTPVLNPANNAPIVSTYGTQDGTSYDNAWNGIASVVWGASGVQAGDTLWVCGPHLYRSALNNFSYTLISIGASGSESSPITIRMDYPGDNGEFFGFWEDKRRPWEGPDVNGVYMQRNAYGEPGAVTSVYPTFYETIGDPSTGSTVYILTNKSTADTWSDGVNGASYVHTGNYITNFARPISVNVTSNLFSRENGYRFNLGSRSNIVFSGCKFTGSYVTATRNGDGSTSANHITFTNCTFAYWYFFDLHPGWDDWTFDTCTFHDMSNGIYLYLDSITKGAQRLTVRNCTISQMGYGREAGDGFFQDNDSHGIGIQGGSGHVIEKNNIQRTGTAIEFWTSYQKMTNNTVRWNFIKDIVVCPVTAGHGIVVSGDNTYSTPGVRTGFQIYGNIILNTGLNQTEDYQGSGISSNNRDPMIVCNNTISNAYSGLRMAVSSYPVVGTFRNNLIVNPKTFNADFVGTGATTATLDNNLYYPLGNTVGNFHMSPTFTHDANSVFDQDPEFVSATGLVAADFRIQATSPAKGKGVPLVALDYFGRAYLNQPAIGAAEISYNQSVQTRRHALTSSL